MLDSLLLLQGFPPLLPQTVHLSLLRFRHRLLRYRQWLRRQYCSRAAYPYVVTDGNRACPFIACISFDRVGAMASSVYANVGTDKAVVANGDVSLIEHHKVEIGKESFSYTYVFAIITEERLVNVSSSLLPKIC